MDREEVEKMAETVKCIIDLLSGPHVQDNKYRMGALGSGDIDRALTLLRGMSDEL